MRDWQRRLVKWDGKGRESVVCVIRNCHRRQKSTVLLRDGGEAYVVDLAFKMRACSGQEEYNLDNIFLAP